MTTPKAEPTNWFYVLLNVASLAFVVTALAYALVPLLEQRAREAGQKVPPSPFRDALRADGWKWLLVEVAAVTVLAALSMGLDRLRRWKTERGVADNRPIAPPPPPAAG